MDEYRGCHNSDEAVDLAVPRASLLDGQFVLLWNRGGHVLRVLYKGKDPFSFCSSITHSQDPRTRQAVYTSILTAPLDAK